MSQGEKSFAWVILSRGLFGEVLEQQPVGIGWENGVVELERRLDFLQPGQQLPGAFLILQGFRHAPLNLGAQHLGDIFAQVVFDEDPVALLVNPFPLRVEHIVVFQQMLADIKVGAFHPRLRLFDQPADHAHFQGQSIVDLQALHQVVRLLAAEQAHQFVFHGEVEA